MSEPRSHMNRVWPRGPFVLLLSALVASSCTGQGRQAENGREVTADVEAEVEQFLSEQGGGSFNDRGQTTVVDVSMVEITLEEFSFEPTVLLGRAGQELRVVLANAGNGPHTFTMDDQDVHVPMRLGQNAQATVTIPSDDAPVLFYCRFHREQGMVGALALAHPT
jgi:plastocyanin